MSCCPVHGERFRSNKHHTDQLRLELVLKSAKDRGQSSSAIRKIRTCGCPCHSDGGGRIAFE
ncbi:hypothetical protein HNP46_000483 [Pseudomonas nitritireducens]|uniref:Uncharacterized protein n=1 Tax=Pseudomonas nitroreducens TaxID=46680 RepID=A0A7W7KF43_PSENT|nr:hypothetical protein [Pseudomonas nitritireducens]